MKTVGAYEAKTHLSKLLDDVARGERITITRHGVPVATLAPVDAPQKRSVEETIKELKAFGKGRKLGDLTIEELIEEGRRF